MEWFLARVRELDVVREAPRPLLLGRDVLALGLPPGPEVGRIVREVYERQLDGEVKTHEDAVLRARHLLEAGK
jgi:tRNA nucleotidyltransferase (CCA-adding enzyme)